MAQVKKEQTKGFYKLAGKVKGINNENAFKEGVTKNDDPYKSLSFFVETSPVNAIRVEMFAMERNTVVFWNSKEKDNSKKRKDVPWADRNKSFAPFGLMGIRVGLEKKAINLVEWDAIDYLVKNLTEGQDVYITGQIDYQKYQDQQGNWQESKRFNIGSIGNTKKPIDFEAEDFIELASFEQDIVVTDVMVTDEKKLMIGAKIIDYKGEAVDTTFIVDPEVDDKKYVKLAQNMKKRLKWGDFIKVYGLCINMVEMLEVEAEVETDDWGGEMPTGQGELMKNYIQELRVTAVDSTSYEPKKYTEEDFFSQDEENFGGDPFGGDEFEDEDTGIGFGDDDDSLPFG